MTKMFGDFKEVISNSIDTFGLLNLKTKTIEVLNYYYEFDHNLEFKTAGDQLQYVIDKLSLYESNLNDVKTRLAVNEVDRQCVILFDQSLPLPNCTVSIQFQIRGKKLYLSVFQRSQDIEKLEMDCDIFARMAKEVILSNNDICNGEFDVKVFVGNMHKYIKE